MSDYCTDCKKKTEVVVDRAAGDSICSECGLILEAYCVDEKYEWRTLANDSNGYSNFYRIGQKYNPLLTDDGLSTIISMPDGASGETLNSSLVRCQGRGLNTDENLISAFNSISNMCDRLELVTVIKDRAKDIYKKVEDQKQMKVRNLDLILAACIYIACRLENTPRTVNEICPVANGATKKEILRAKEFIMKQLELGGEMGTIHGADYMRRFCSNLGLPNQDVKAAQEMVLKSEKLDIRRSPISVAAAVIYTITQLSNEKRSLKEVAVATNVAEQTIKKAYKELQPHLTQIIPSWYATETDIRKQTNA